MAAIQPSMRQLRCGSSIFRELKNYSTNKRLLHTIYSSPKERTPFPQDLPEQFIDQIPKRFRPDKPAKKIQVYPPPPTPCSTYKEPVTSFMNNQLATLDPTGERKKLFDAKSRQGIKVGDILRVTYKNGDPFSGVCINIRQRGVDTAFLLRNRLSRVGCEMWTKVFSPNVSGVEIVKRNTKRLRRARLLYMRKPKHDMGSVENIVRNYLREKEVLSGGQSRRRHK